MNFKERLAQEEQTIEKLVVRQFKRIHSGDGKLGDQMMPIFHIVDSQWRAHVVGAGFEDYLDKDVIADFIRQYCGKEGALLCVFATEAWYIEAKPDEDIDGVQPSKHPNRLEALMIYFDSALGHRLVLHKIKRGGGNSVSLGDRQSMDSGEVEGRFTGLVHRSDA